MHQLSPLDHINRRHELDHAMRAAMSTFHCGCGSRTITVTASNNAIAGSILASPAFAFVALIDVAVASILMLPTHQSVNLFGACFIDPFSNFRSDVLMLFMS